MIELFLSFATGLITKTLDLAEDHGLKINKSVKAVLSVLNGLIIAYIISVVNVLPGFWFGIVLGLILSRKIDAESHQISFAFLLIGLVFFGFPVMNPVIVILTSLICIAEEWVNDEFVDKNRVKGLFKKFLSARPLLEAASVILAFYYSNITIFLLLFTFDAGYLLSHKLFK